MPDGGHACVRIVLGAPESRGAAWGAPYAVYGPGPDDVVERVIFGADALQALALALRVLPEELARFAALGTPRELGFDLGMPPQSGAS